MCFFRKNRNNQASIDDSDQKYDFKKLRRDLETEYTVQGQLTTGGYGYSMGIKARKASNEELLKMAKEMNFKLEKYSK